MENRSNDLIKLTGLWKQESKDGKVYYSGNLSRTAKVLLFKNDKRKNEKDPDLMLCLAQLKKKELPEKKGPPEEPEEEVEPI